MIRIFIVDADPEARKAIREMLAAEIDIKLVGEISSEENVLDVVEKAKPHIILLDAGNINGEIIGLATVLQASSSHPALIMTSDQNDMALIRQSMIVGARDHLLKPFNAQELVQAIHTVFDASGVGLAHKARLVGFLGCRGGAGNTTVALSFAGAAVRKGLRVAVVDGNLTLGDASFLLNARPETTWTDWSKDCMRSEVDPRKYLVRSPEGIDILSAPLNPAQAELVKVESVSRVLNALRDSHDVVVVDIPDIFNEITLELAEGVQDLYLVSDPSLTGIKNLRLIWDLLEQLRFPHEKRAVLLNRVQKKDQQTVKETTKGYPYLESLPMETEMEKGWLKGETPAKVRRRSSFAKSINKILESVISPEGQK